MPVQFDLVITADYASRTADFRLLDQHGSQLAFRRTEFNTIPEGQQHGLFDLRNYLRQYVEPGQEQTAAAGIGVCIAEQVLGREIFEPLWQSSAQRTLRIQLPGAAQEENLLAAALARVPWEIARPTVTAETLGERNLLVRVVHWSGHGHLNLLELAKPGGLKDHLSGQQLLDLFSNAGGFLPRLVVLSACHLGDILRVKNWNDFLAAGRHAF